MQIHQSNQHPKRVYIAKEACRKSLGRHCLETLVFCLALVAKCQPYMLIGAHWNLLANFRSFLFISLWLAGTFKEECCPAGTPPKARESRDPSTPVQFPHLELAMPDRVRTHPIPQCQPTPKNRFTKFKGPVSSFCPKRPDEGRWRPYNLINNSSLRDACL